MRSFFGPHQLIAQAKEYKKDSTAQMNIKRSFEGVEDIRFITERSYYKGASRNRKPLSYRGINRQSLETRFKDMNNATYLKSLIVSEDVKKLEASYATPIEVTVLTEEVIISKGVEMFTNRLDIEYEY